MKEEKTKIAKNTSSGAEKVEKIQKTVQNGEKKVKISTEKEVSAKAESAMGKEKQVDAKKMNASLSASKAEKESKQAKKRVQAALAKKKEKDKKKAEKKELAKKKAAERKQKFAERQAKIKKMFAEKKAELEKLKAESQMLAEKQQAEMEQRRRERAHAKANKKQQAKKSTSKRQKPQRQRKERKEGGYGGWLAAVISLGAVTLALTTAVTVGAIDMSQTKEGVLSTNRATMYELTGVMEHIDSDLDRVRISASPAQQSRILTDLLVQTRLAEQDLERVPVSAETDRNITIFLNRTGKACEMMLAKLRRGEELAPFDMERLESLYQTNHKIRGKLDELMNKMSDKDITEFMKKGAGMVADALKDLEQMTLEENRSAIQNAKEKMGERKPSLQEQDEGNANSIEPAKAEALCSNYFSDYPIAKFQCVGETVSFGYSAYNVQGYDDKGTLLFAELSQKDGRLLRFDYYESCDGENFDMDNAKRIAEEFLQKLGYEDMEAVRVRENGTTTDFTYVYSQNGVAYYPDEVRVKVCRTRGKVTGIDSVKYMKNHQQRIEPSVKLSLAEAQNKLHKGLEVLSSRLAIVQTMRGEQTAYEFLCGYGEEKYFVYLSATTGDEISIINAKVVS